MSERIVHIHNEEEYNDRVYNNKEAEKLVS